MFPQRYSLAIELIWTLINRVGDIIYKNRKTPNLEGFLLSRSVDLAFKVLGAKVTPYHHHLVAKVQKHHDIQLGISHCRGRLGVCLVWCWGDRDRHNLERQTDIINVDCCCWFIFVFWEWQSGALSLVGIVEVWLSLVESLIELKYFQDVATPALLCHKEPARRIQSPKAPCLLLAGSLWHKG